MSSTGFLAEYARSGRSRCKSCKDGISQGVLRMGETGPNPFAGGAMMTSWYHLDCFFRRMRRMKDAGSIVTDEDDIENFEELLPKDKARIQKRLQEYQEYLETEEIEIEPSAPPAPAAAAGAGAGQDGRQKNPGEDDGLPERFCIEYAKSQSSTCRGCGEKIRRGELRIGQPMKAFFKAADPNAWIFTYCHPECFWKPEARMKVALIATPLTDAKAQLEGFEDLAPEDQEMIADLVDRKQGSSPFQDRPSVYLEHELVDQDGYDKTVFWEITVAGRRSQVRYGLKGRYGVSQIKEHTDGAAARAYATKAIRQKLRKYTLKQGSLDTFTGKRKRSQDSEAEDEGEDDDDDDDGEESEEEEKKEEQPKQKKEKKTKQGKKKGTPAQKKVKTMTPGAEEDETEESLMQLRVVDLRGLCRERGLCSRGKKADLVQKLLHA